MTKFFCPLPWIHQFIQADGIKMCCSSNTKLDISSEEFFNSTYLNDIKNNIRQGIIPKDCQGCINLESQGYSSTRTLALKDWIYDIDNVPNELIYLDLRNSNLCNFKCRSCEPNFSSEIAREIHQNLQLQKYHKLTPIHTENTKSYGDLKNVLANIQRINFTGGEPLLIKKNISILEDLVSAGNTKCELLITTNVSIINNKILNLTKKFNQVHWTLSIDAVNNVAEYVRYGTIWESIHNNIIKILSTKRSVAFNTTLTAYNILDLSNLLKYFKQLKNTYDNQPFELWFSICSSPKFLNPLVLNDKTKNKALIELKESIKILSTIENNPDRSIQTLKSLQKNLEESIINTELYNYFVDYTKELDQIRNQNFEETFGLKL